MAELQPALGESGLGECMSTIRARVPVLESESPDFVDLSTVKYALHVISLDDLACKIHKFIQEGYHLL